MIKQTLVLEIRGQPVRLLFVVDKEIKVKAFVAMSRPYLSQLNQLLQRTFGLEENAITLRVESEK